MTLIMKMLSCGYITLMAVAFTVIECNAVEINDNATKKLSHKSMVYKRFEEQVLFSTVRIVVDTNDPQKQVVGTGFLLSVALKDYPDKSIILLISNKHVFGDAKHNTAVAFHLKNEKDGTPLLGRTFIVSGRDITNSLIGHPDPNIDLTCLNISGINGRSIFYKAIPEDMVSTFDEEDLVPGGEVWFIGYPDNRFDSINNLPIMRRGYIASAPKVDFNGLKQFVIDAQVFPGSSGSPVFGILGNKYKFLGVISQTMIKNEVLQAIPTSLNYRVHQIIGLGIVIKPDLVMELIEMARKGASDSYKEELKARK